MVSRDRSRDRPRAGVADDGRDVLVRVAGAPSDDGFSGATDRDRGGPVLRLDPMLAVFAGGDVAVPHGDGMPAAQLVASAAWCLMRFLLVWFVFRAQVLGCCPLTAPVARAPMTPKPAPARVPRRVPWRTTILRVWLPLTRAVLPALGMFIPVPPIRSLRWAAKVPGSRWHSRFCLLLTPGCRGCTVADAAVSIQVFVKDAFDGPLRVLSLAANHRVTTVCQHLATLLGYPVRALSCNGKRLPEYRTLADAGVTVAATLHLHCAGLVGGMERRPVGDAGGVQTAAGMLTLRELLQSVKFNVT